MKLYCNERNEFGILRGRIKEQLFIVISADVILTMTCEKWSLNNATRTVSNDCSYNDEDTRVSQFENESRRVGGRVRRLAIDTTMGWLGCSSCTLWVWHYVMIIHGVSVFYYRHWFRMRCTRHASWPPLSNAACNRARSFRASVGTRCRHRVLRSIPDFINCVYVCVIQRSDE